MRPVLQWLVAGVLLICIGLYVHSLHLGDEIAQLGDRTFVLLKTGVEVMDQRVPIHLHTTFKWFPHHEIYAEVDTPVLGHPVVNAISYLPAEGFQDENLGSVLVRYRAIDEQWGWGASNVVVHGKNIGWHVDVFKNVPSYALAWLKDPTKDWYVMLDDDTYMLPSTLAKAVEGKNPEEMYYLGRNVGQNPFFAYGGSGMVFSRGALKAMFGVTKESTQAAVMNSMELAYGSCCGDIVICYLYGQQAHDFDHIRDHLEMHDDSGLFQGTNLWEFIAAFRHWCDPVGSFHHGKAGDYDMISRWYDRLRQERGKNYRPTYYDYYEEFIMPHVAVEIEGWIVDHSEEFEDSVSFSHEDAPTRWKCKELCETDQTCMQWSFREGQRCKLIRNGVVAGQAYNEYKPNYDAKEHVVGYMVTRIIAHRKNPRNFCDPINSGKALPLDKTEGWLHRQLESGPIPVPLNNFLYD